ncbi:response regulator transcription factor [Planctomicrobium sp. SH527]|uniref:response regulator transcription factor n=1 Tax=Planctomicrobium sp. SH527 TaxID=3448123 RepID=UPI003F5B37DA
MRLLIVEDEADLLRRLTQVLRREGYAVDTAGDGDTGLDKARENNYDAILLDAMLPVFDGWELLTQLRKTKATPVLMLTARDASQDRVRGLDYGADDYVLKPFDLPELLARVRALIRRGAVAASARLDFGEIIIDTAQRCVWRHGEVVPLLPSEYSLLEYLALHRGEVVSRTTLFDHLFDENDDTLSNLLDVRVSNLRRKLGQTFIITRRGHGYGIGIEP